MNERIKQLAEQARKYAEDKQNDPLKIYTLDCFNEKFAELIVRECMDIAHNVGNISEPDDWALDRCYEIEQRIQDRFGVEE
jgi:hypothetical protein